MKKICEKLGSQHEYLQLIADNIPALIKCVKPFDSMHDDLIQLLTVFLRKSKSKKYGQRIAIKTIQSMQYFAQVVKIRLD